MTHATETSRTIHNVTFTLSAAEACPGRYSKANLSASHPEGGRCEWSAVWDESDPAGTVEIRALTSTVDVPSAVRRLALAFAREELAE